MYMALSLRATILQFPLAQILCKILTENSSEEMQQTSKTTTILMHHKLKILSFFESFTDTVFSSDNV